MVIKTDISVQNQVIKGSFNLFFGRSIFIDRDVLVHMETDQALHGALGGFLEEHAATFKSSLLYVVQDLSDEGALAYPRASNDRGHRGRPYTSGHLVETLPGICDGRNRIPDTNDIAEVFCTDDTVWTVLFGVKDCLDHSLGISGNQGLASVLVLTQGCYLSQTDRQSLCTLYRSCTARSIVVKEQDDLFKAHQVIIIGQERFLGGLTAIDKTSCRPFMPLDLRYGNAI
jgi:hypothetical protein